MRYRYLDVILICYSIAVLDTPNVPLYLACAKTCLWVTHCYSRNFSKSRKGVDTTLCPRKQQTLNREAIPVSW